MEEAFVDEEVICCTAKEKGCFLTENVECLKTFCRGSTVKINYTIVPALG